MGSAATKRGGGRVINYKALEGRRRPTTGGCAARRMCKGMIMPNGEILPTGPALLGHGRGRVLIFSTGFPTFPRARGKIIFVLRETGRIPVMF